MDSFDPEYIRNLERQITQDAALDAWFGVLGQVDTRRVNSRGFNLHTVAERIATHGSILDAKPAPPQKPETALGRHGIGSGWKR